MLVGKTFYDYIMEFLRLLNLKIPIYKMLEKINLQESTCINSKLKRWDNLIDIISHHTSICDIWGVLKDIHEVCFKLSIKHFKERWVNITTKKF